jgi:preprotein translocase SecE subunit
MSVAIKNSPETSARRQVNALAVGSIAGTLYVLGSLAVIFYGIRRAWSLLVPTGAGPFVDRALLIMLMAAAAFGLAILGRRLLGQHPPHGIRAGIFFGVFGVLIGGLLTLAVGGAFDKGDASAFGLPLTVVLGVVLLVAGGYAFFRPNFDAFLLRVEDQGWWTATAYKRSQGQRVRRGTILAILILAGSGVYTLLAHHTLESGAANWEVIIPFTGGQTLTLLPDLQFTLPILIAAIAIWFAYRLVNFPPFADFLIATEAELNKVSWTTRKRLVQDTIVVLTTMFLITLFLFVVDVGWYHILKSPWIAVLQAPTTSADLKTLDEQIERISRERQSALDANDTQKAEALRDQLAKLSKRREQIQSEVKGEPQDW